MFLWPPSYKCGYFVPICFFLRILLSIRSQSIFDNINNTN
ncbi:unnamed protein product, partial [Arabidopsis halleri]